MSSVVDICNLALSWLGANLITSLEDETTEASLCDANYDLMRDAVLEAADWTFAIKRARLVPLVEVPVFGQFNMFAVPSDSLRVLTVSEDEDDRRRVEWQIESGNILAHRPNAYARYIERVEDPLRYSPLFIHALAARIACDLAIPIVESRTLRNENWDLYQRKLGEAVANDGIQGKHPVIRSDTLKVVRWSHTMARYGLR